MIYYKPIFSIYSIACICIMLFDFRTSRREQILMLLTSRNDVTNEVTF